MSISEDEDHWEALSREVREFGVFSRIERLQPEEMTPLLFMREYVAQNKPCIISGGIAHWPAMKLWTQEYLSEKLGDKEVTVDITPNGYGDAVTQRAGKEPAFVTPEERRMTMSAFFSLQRRSMEEEEEEDPAGTQSSVLGVPYLSHQNSSLYQEFQEVAEDVEEIGWATEALGEKPEAVNMWVGDQRAVTSFHKDHYENLYGVVAGSKHFTLLPPADYPRLHTAQYPRGRFAQYPPESGEWEIIMEEEDSQRSGACASSHEPSVKDEETDAVKNDSSRVWWSPINPYPSDAASYEIARAQYPRFFGGMPPLECDIHAGDLLYLPALWYHHVRQSAPSNGLTIAVNFWYDMVFDHKFAYFNFVQNTFDTRRRLDSSYETKCVDEDEVLNDG